MRVLRPLLVVVLLLLGLPWLWPAPRSAEPSHELPVQVRLQADLAFRLIRLVDLGGTGLPPQAGQDLEQGATALLDQGLIQRPGNPDLLIRRALLSARSGDLAGAQQILSRLDRAARNPATATLEQAWREQAPSPGAMESLRQGLDGYARYLALDLTGCVEAAEALRPEEEARARKDLFLLSLLAGLTLTSLGLGLLAWVLLPWAGRRHDLSNGRIPSPTRWLPLGALAFLVGFQVLVALVGSQFFSILGRLGLSRVAAGVTAQILVYLLALAILVRLLPRMARPKEACEPRALLGLSRPRPGDLLAGLVGFWMALPAVLAASWATSVLLGHSPFSSNPALEMILRASPGELAAMGLLTALAAPFFEEVLFRGVIFAGLRASLGPWMAGLVSSMLFALLHGDPQALLVLTALGGIFAALYHKTGSLWPAVLAHGLWNGATVTAMVLLMTNR